MVEILKKGQKYLDTFWHILKEDYLLSLGKLSQTVLILQWKQFSVNPILGDIVVIRDTLLRASWKLGGVELIESFDRLIRAARVQLGNQKIITSIKFSLSFGMRDEII